MGYNCNAGIRWGCKYNAKGYSRHLIYHYVFNIHFVRYSLLLIGLINICSCKVIDFLRVLTCVYIFRLLCSQLNCLKTLNFAVYCVYSYLVGDKCILREFFSRSLQQNIAYVIICRLLTGNATGIDEIDQTIDIKWRQKIIRKRKKSCLEKLSWNWFFFSLTGKS